MSNDESITTSQVLSLPIQVPQDAMVEPAGPAAKLAFEGGGHIVVGRPSLVHKDRNFLLIGRQAATCDIRITHKSLSRQHAVLYYCDSRDDDEESSSLFLVDLNTKTGTFVDNQRIEACQPMRLKSGNTIKLGKAQQTFILDWDPKSSSSNDPQNVHVVEEPTRNEDMVDDDKPVLTGREQRKAEIAAMMASLDEAPTYTKFEPVDERETTAVNKAVSAQETTSREMRILEKYKLPFQHSVSWTVLDSSSISAMAMDPSGTRFAIGSMDSALRLYDFGGFNPDNPSPFQNTYVQEGYPVRSIAYAPTGDRFVVATGSTQPRLMDRDGSEQLLEFARGDVYVTDPAKTTGHTAAVTCIQWHPLEKSTVYTTSRDGSLRRWNVDSGKLAFGMLKCGDVIVIKNLKTGRKTIPTCMAITPKLIAMGTECGSVQIYDHSFKFKLRPQQSIVPQSESEKEAPPVLSLVFSMDGARLACRTSMAVFVYNTELRLSASSTPMLIATDVGSRVQEDNSTPTLAFSPDNKIICIGVTNERTQDGVVRSESRLDLYVIPKEGSSSEKRMRGPILSSPLGPDDSITGLSWHCKLNQLLVSTAKSCNVWYSSDHSQKGVLLSAKGRRRTKRNMEEDLQSFYEARAPPPGSSVGYNQIIAPNALPMFGGDSSQKRKQRKLDQQEEDNKRKNPQQPTKSVYNTPNTIFAQLVVDNQTVDQKVIAGIDPREALAKYSEGKSFIGTAYKGNTERILADRTVEEEEDDMKKK